MKLAAYCLGIMVLACVLAYAGAYAGCLVNLYLVGGEVSDAIVPGVTIGLVAGFMLALYLGVRWRPKT